MKPPPATAAVASEGTPMLTPTGQDEVPTTPGLGDADVPMSAPSLKGPPAAVTPFDVEDEGERVEPLAKRQKLSTRRVAGEEFCHMDIESYEHIDEQIDSGLTTIWMFLDGTTTTIWHARTFEKTFITGLDMCKVCTEGIHSVQHFEHERSHRFGHV